MSSNLNFATIGSFKYFIMPNKRWRSKAMNSLKKITLFSLYFMYVLCLIQVNAVEKSRNFNQTSREGVSSEPTVTRLVKLHQERARLECNLAPLASARYRARRQPASATEFAMTSPSSRHKLSGDVKGITLDGSKEISVSQNGSSDSEFGGPLQDGAVIDEMPARAAIGDRLSQLRPVRNSRGLNSQIDPQTRFPESERAGTESAAGSESKFESESESEFESELGSVTGSGSEPELERGIENNAGDNEQLYLSPTDQDSVELILWYHNSQSATKPIYTLDARQRSDSGNSMQTQHQYNLARLSPKSEADASSLSDNEDENEDSIASPANLLNYSTRLKTSDINISSNESSSQSSALSNNDRFMATNQSLTAGVLSRNAKHFVMPKLSTRIRFRISSKKAKAYLMIEKLEIGDAGEYKCRVDFKYARTQYQLTRLQVITPVSRVQIKISKQSKRNGKDERVDLWPPSEIVGQVSHSSPPLALLGVNEDESIQLECKAKDGWPKAKLAWFRVDWLNLASSRLDLATRVTQLSIFPTEMESTVAHTFGPINKSEDLINTLSRLEKDNKIPLSPYKSEQQYLNVNNPTTNLDAQWLSWVGSELKIAIRNVFENLEPKLQQQQQLLMQNLDSNKSTVISMLARELSSVLDAKVDSRNSPIQLLENSNSNSNSNTNTNKTNSELINSKQSDLSSIQEEVLLRTIRQNQLVLYTCGSSNTHDHNKLLSLNDNELGDKLAEIRPLFKSILVQHNVRPQWIQMFLVSKRRFASNSKPERVELTPLQKGQNLHLNLAASWNSSSADRQQQQQQQSLYEDEGSEYQLQLVCQVGGSLPEAKIEWYKYTYHGLDENITNDILAKAKINGGQIAKLPLISDSKFETRSLIRASKSSSLSFITPNSTSNNSGLLQIQWSSVKVHNITFEDHQTAISCSAYNEKFSSSSNLDSSLNDEDVSTSLSTSLKLNITHVPSIKLELDSAVKVSGFRPSSSHYLQEDHQEFDVTALRDSPSLNTSTNSRKAFNGDHFNDNLDLSTINYNNDKLSDNQQKDIRPVLIGYNYSLVCGVIFANPFIYEPIEWYLNYKEANETDKEHKYELFDEVNWLVKVVERTSTRNRYNIIEKLIVQFSDNWQSKKRIQLKCKARNALGQTQSNVIKIVTGQKPECQKSNLKSFELVANRSNSGNNKGNGLADKRNEPSIQCPVISDESSSQYYWLIQLDTDSRHKKMNTDNLLTQASDFTRSGFKPTKPKSPNINSINDKSIAPAKTISNTFEFFTSNRTIRLSTLKLILSENSLNNVVDENDSLAGLKITCFAMDQFGSNINDLCAVSLIGGGQRRSVEYSASHIQCVASLIRANNRTIKLEQPLNNFTNNFSIINSTDKKHVLIIECRDDNINNSSQLKRVRGSNLKERKDEVVHFDLYTRDENKFVKHLTSYSKDEDSNNLSLKIDLDLGQDSSSLPIENFEKQHVVVMSFTDSNNRQRQPNFTLTLADSNSNSDSSQTLDKPNDSSLSRLPDFGQVFSHTRSSDSLPTSGHGDGLWVISSVCVMFASSIMVLLIAWMCLSGGNKGTNKAQGSVVDSKINSNNNNNNNNNSESNNKVDAGDNNNASQASDLAQTEMYLVGDQLQVSRPTVYHNFTTANPFISTSITNINERLDQGDCDMVTTSFNCGHTGSTSFNKAGTTDPYDLLIIDSKLSDNADTDITKEAILLINNPHAQNRRALRARFDQGCDADGCDSQSGSTKRGTLGTGGGDLSSQHFNESSTIEEQCDLGSMIHLRPTPTDNNNAILRTIYYNKETCKDCPNFGNQNLGIMLTSKIASSPEIQASGITKHSPVNSEFINFNCKVHEHKLVRSPIGFMTSLVSQNSGRYNTTGFEPNSLGELTITDESSSFMQEEGVIDTQLNPSQSVCYQYNAVSDIHQRDTKSMNIYTTSDCCKECQRITPNTTPSDGNQSSASVTLLPKIINFDLSSKANQAPTLKKSATSRENESKRSEGVRFVDPEL